MKVPLKDDINTGDWLRCCCKMFENDEEEFNFRFRATSMMKVVMHEIDDPGELILDHGILWLLKIDVVNMNKMPITSHYVGDVLVLLDQDDFLFKAVDDSHLTALSDYATSSGLCRFNGWSNSRDLSPKIKSSGALAYLLPDDEDAEYFLSVEFGTIEAI